MSSWSRHSFQKKLPTCHQHPLLISLSGRISYNEFLELWNSSWDAALRKAKRHVAYRRIGYVDSLVSDFAENCSDSSSALHNTSGDDLYMEKFVDTQKAQDAEGLSTPSSLLKTTAVDDNTCHLRREHDGKFCFNRRKELSIRVKNCT